MVLSGMSCFLLSIISMHYYYYYYYLVLSSIKLFLPCKLVLVEGIKKLLSSNINAYCTLSAFFKFNEILVLVSQT